MADELASLPYFHYSLTRGDCETVLRTTSGRLR